MTKLLKIILLLFLFTSVKGENYSKDDYETIPDVFDTQLTLSYLNDIYNGNVNLRTLARSSKAKWTVFSDRSENKLYNSYEGAPNTEKLDLLEELYVLSSRNNWLKVVTKRKINNHYIEGWIKAENLILSRYSLKTEPKNGVSVPRKAIILTDIDAMTKLGIKPKDAMEFRFFYSRPQTNNKYIESEATAFQIYFVLKEQDGSLLLSNNDVLEGNLKTNQAKVMGWVSGVNVRKWNHRVALEPTRTTEAIEEYKNFNNNGKLLGYTDLEKLEKGIETGLYPKLAQVEFRVRPIISKRMRKPVMERVDGNSNLVKIVSINRETSDLDDDSKLKNNEIIEKLNRKQAKTNIIFAIDATASMKYYMKRVSSTVQRIIDQNEKLNLNELKFGLIVYRDYKDGNDIKAPAYKVYPLTTDYESIKEAISTTVCRSKDKDMPEAVYNGLINGLNEMNLNEQESNIVVLIGDCGNHRPSSPSYNKNHSLKNVIKIFDEKSINLLSLQVNHTLKDSHFDFNDDIIDIITETANNKIRGKNSKLIVDFEKIKDKTAYELKWRTKNNDPRDDYENMFGRFIYAKNGSMDGDFLEKSIVDVIGEYSLLTQNNIKVLRKAISVGSYNKNIEVDTPPEGLTVHIMKTFNMSRTEAQDFLQRKEVTISAYVAMDYSKMGINALKEVVFLSDKEKRSLTRSLRKLSKDECKSNTDQKKCFQENMIEVCRSLLGYNTSLETIENLTMNQVWEILIGSEFKNNKLKNIKLNSLSEIRNKDFKKFYNDFKSKASSFADNSYVNESDHKSRRFSLSGSYFYWIPLEDLPGTTE